MILFTPMAHHGRLGSLTDVAADSAAIVRNGATEAGDLRRRQPGDRSTPAVADHGNFAGALRDIESGLGILHRVTPVQLDRMTAARFDVSRPIAQIHTLLRTVKELGSNHEITIRGVTIRNLAHVVVDAEYFLNQYDAAASLACGFGTVSRELKAVG